MSDAPDNTDYPPTVDHDYNHPEVNTKLDKLRNEIDYLSERLSLDNMVDRYVYTNNHSSLSSAINMIKTVEHIPEEYSEPIAYWNPDAPEDFSTGDLTNAYSNQFLSEKGQPKNLEQDYERRIQFALRILGDEEEAIQILPDIEYKINFLKSRIRLRVSAKERVRFAQNDRQLEMLQRPYNLPDQEASKVVLREEQHQYEQQMRVFHHIVNDITRKLANGVNVEDLEHHEVRVLSTANYFGIDQYNGIQINSVIEPANYNGVIEIPSSFMPSIFYSPDGKIMFAEKPTQNPSITSSIISRLLTCIDSDQIERHIEESIDINLNPKSMRNLLHRFFNTYALSLKYDLETGQMEGTQMENLIDHLSTRDVRPTNRSILKLYARILDTHKIGIERDKRIQSLKTKSRMGSAGINDKSIANEIAREGNKDMAMNIINDYIGALQLIELF